MSEPDTVEVLVGYLVTHPDGYQVRLAPDRTRVELYAARAHAVIEPIYVKRPASHQAGSGAGACGDGVSARE